MIPKLGKDEGWAPNIKQEPFLAIPWSIKEAFYGGGAGSGKSDVLLYYPLVHKLHLNPRFKQVFMRRTFPEIRNEIMPRSKDIYRRFGASFNKGDMTFTFPRPDQLGGTGMANDGAMVYLAHCESEDDVHKYDSMEINLYTPDELTSYTEWIYLYIGFTRVRTSDPTLPAIIRAAGMPGNIGHGWVKKRFVDPHKDGGKIIVGRGGVKRIFIRATQADNPHIDPTYAASLEGLPEAEKNAKLYGDFDAYLGQVFEEFRDRLYPDEPLNALHVIPKFDIPDWWPRLLIGDWGFAAMTYILHVAISPTSRIYCYREQFFRKMKIEEWAPYVKEYIDRENYKRVVFCKSVGNERGQEHTIQEQISDAIGMPVELSDNNPGKRIAGKLLLHEYLRWKTKYVPQREKVEYNELHAQWLYRNKGLREYEDYLRMFEPPKSEDNIPKLQIFEGECPLLVNAIKSCVYAKSTDGIPNEDVAEFDGDDPYDTIRYACDAADRFFNEASRDFDRLQAQEVIVQKLKETQDWTSYYRESAKLEKSGKIFAIKRFHGGRSMRRGMGGRSAIY